MCSCRYRCGQNTNIYIYRYICTIGSLIRTVQMVLYLNRVGHSFKLKYRLRLGLDRNGRLVEQWNHRQRVIWWVRWMWHTKKGGNVIRIEKKTMCIHTIRRHCFFFFFIINLSLQSMRPLRDWLIVPIFLSFRYLFFSLFLLLSLSTYYI